MIDFQGLLAQIGAIDFTPLLLALVCGGLIGLEREIHGRPAGLRTHMLVCLLSTGLMYASRAATAVPSVGGAQVVFDPQRLAAGIVTGIGFLGAAAVVRSGDIVRGLTTGATVWAVAALGVVLGVGAFGLAIVLTGAMLLVLVALDRLPHRMGTVVYRRLRMLGASRDLAPLVAAAREVLHRHDVRVLELTGKLEGDASAGFEIVFDVRCRDTMSAPQIMREIADLEGIESVSWQQPGR